MSVERVRAMVSRTTGLLKCRRIGEAFPVSIILENRRSGLSQSALLSPKLLDLS